MTIKAWFLYTTHWVAHSSLNALVSRILTYAQWNDSDSNQQVQETHLESAIPGLLIISTLYWGDSMRPQDWMAERK